MRFPIISLLIANAALISAIDPASAQSPYSYPWCSRSGDRNTYNTCYFVSKEQCMTNLSGICAFCFHNPEYRPGPQGSRQGHDPTPSASSLIIAAAASRSGYES